MVGSEVVVGTTVGTRVVETTPVPVGAAVLLLPVKLVIVETRVKLMVLVRVSVDVMVVVLRVVSWALTATRGRRSAAAIDLNCIVPDMFWVE